MEEALACLFTLFENKSIWGTLLARRRAFA
jgi:hypothetical protein